MDSLSIGIAALDDQHRVFIGLVDRLDALSMEPAVPRREMRLILADLVTYAERHFIEEERQMAAYGYPLLMEHRATHDAAASAIHDSLISDTGEAELYIFLANFLKTWLVTHIMGADQAFGEWLRVNRPEAESA